MSYLSLVLKLILSPFTVSASLAIFYLKPDLMYWVIWTGIRSLMWIDILLIIANKWMNNESIIGSTSKKKPMVLWSFYILWKKQMNLLFFWCGNIFSQWNMTEHFTHSWLSFQSCIVLLLFTQTSNTVYDNIIFLFCHFHIRLCESCNFYVFLIITCCNYYLNDIHYYLNKYYILVRASKMPKLCYLSVYAHTNTCMYTHTHVAIMYKIYIFIYRQSLMYKCSHSS